MGQAQWLLVFAINAVINAIECFAHIQIDDLAVSSFLSTASSIVSIEAIREVSVECHFLFRLCCTASLLFVVR